MLKLVVWTQIKASLFILCGQEPSKNIKMSKYFFFFASALIAEWIYKIIQNILNEKI